METDLGRRRLASVMLYWSRVQKCDRSDWTNVVYDQVRCNERVRNGTALEDQPGASREDCREDQGLDCQGYFLHPIEKSAQYFNQNP